MRSMRQWEYLACCVMVVGLALPGCALRYKMASLTEQPIIASAQPFRVLDVCLDTPPLMPQIFFRKAADAVADRIDASVTVNFGGMVVYVSRISSNSFQDDPLTFRIPAMAPDQPMPQHPQSSGDYGDADRERAYQNALAEWQKRLIGHHRELAQLQRWVRQQTNKLRTLPDPYDARGADLYGCLADASAHLQQTPGEKYLIIASAMVNNTFVQKTDHLNLSGVTVEVIWRTCQVAASCQSSDEAWGHLFRQGGARRVSFSDPAESEVSGPQF